ncbi:TlpA disulfide reductase family protein [Chitinophaga sp.]|uniref:TlpA disulfide reductase family protein n=1 Tax=Chitinophaga sp. TaxID=1869181 RepID=UPI0031D7D184
MHKLIFTLLLPVIGVAQQKNFSIQGTTPAVKNGCKVYLDYQSDGKNQVDSTVVKNGHFSFTGTVQELCYARMVFDHENKGRYWVVNVGDRFYFYLANETYKVAITDSLKKATVTGSPTHKAYAAFLSQIGGGFMNIIDSANQEMSAATDTAAIPAIRKKYDSKFAAMHEKERKFISAHPDSYFSIVALTDVANKAPMSEVEAMYKGLSERVRTTTPGKEMQSRITAAHTIKVGLAAPDFEQPDVNGKPIKLSDFRGKYVLVDFWASWCHPCREENPNLKKAYGVYKDKGLEVLAVSLDDRQTRNAWIKAIETDGLPWVHVSDLKGWQNQVAVLYGIRAVPQNYLVNPEGKIVAQNLRGPELATKLAEYIH